MTLFSGAPLRTLNGIYRFLGGRVTTSEMELDAPITLVHDVSREVELGGFEVSPVSGGFLHLGADNVHAAADNQDTVIDVFSNIDLMAGGSIDRWAWLFYANVSATVQQLSRASLMARHPVVGTALPLRQYALALWNQSIQTNASAPHTFDGFNTENSAVATSGASSPFVQTMPFWMPRGTLLEFRSTSLAAVTLRLQALIWVGAQGVYPPGLR